MTHLISDINKRLFSIQQKEKKIELVWIPSHVGIPGNEEVDQLAKDSLKIHDIEPIKIPYNDLFAIPNKKLIDIQTKNLNENDKDKGTFFFKNYYDNKFKTKPWFYNLPDCRSTIVNMLRLRSGHTSLNDSLFKKK